VRVESRVVVGTPKSLAGVRDVAIPPHLTPILAAHLASSVEPKADALLFPASDGRNMRPHSLYWHYYPARKQLVDPTCGSTIFGTLERS